MGRVKIAAIDVGSNSVRLLLAESRDGRPHGARYERATPRLARGMARSRMLEAQAMEQAIGVLAGYAELIRESSAARVMAVGTSALREAASGGEFVDRVKRETGIRIEIISGEREAELTAQGVLRSLPSLTSALIVDIGGGSTEFIRVEGGRVAMAFTVPFGVVVSHERAVRGDPPDGDDLRRLDRDAELAASEAAGRLGEARAPGTGLVLTAGTATTLASLDLGLKNYDREMVHGRLIGRERLEDLWRTLISQTHAERGGLAGIEPGREDLIIPGTRLTMEIMDRFGFSEATVSDGGLLEGVWFHLAGGVTPSA
jgi:exopolyphosphatase/guanosine-5'-triphosphate,3'-diphosphate pyrophosphatase